MTFNFIFWLLLNVLLLIIFAWILQFLLKYLYLRYRLRNVPGYIGLSFIGMAYKLLKMPRQETRSWYKKITSDFHGKLFVFWIGTRPSISIQKPEDVQVILSNTTHITKSLEYRLITPWLGNRLITSTGKKWLHDRRLLTPAFHFVILDEFVDIIFDYSNKLNEKLENFLTENPGKLVEIQPFLSKFTLYTICKTAMGIVAHSYRMQMYDYVIAVKEFSKLVRRRILNPLYSWDFYYYKTSDGQQFKKTVKKLHNFTSQIVKDKLNKRKSSTLKNEDVVNKHEGRKRRAFLDLLLEASEKAEHPLSVDEIRDQVDTFMFAGHDTTATAINWTLFVLGNAPDIQEKVHEELYEVFGNYGERTFTISELTKLKYLDRVIKETLRLYPSVPYVYRILSEDTVIAGNVIPKGCTVIINIIDLHRDPEIWNNPLKFDPDRFLIENSNGKHPYAFIPFSASPRNCIGQKLALLELKIVLVAILRKWRIQSVQKPNEVKFLTELILRSFEPLKFHLIPLKSQ